MFIVYVIVILQSFGHQWCERAQYVRLLLSAGMLIDLLFLNGNQFVMVS